MFSIFAVQALGHNLNNFALSLIGRPSGQEMSLPIKRTRAKWAWQRDRVSPIKFETRSWAAFIETNRQGLMVSECTMFNIVCCSMLLYVTRRSSRTHTQTQLIARNHMPNSSKARSNRAHFIKTDSHLIYNCQLKIKKFEEGPMTSGVLSSRFDHREVLQEIALLKVNTWLFFDCFGASVPVLRWRPWKRSFSLTIMDFNLLWQLTNKV